MLKQIEKFIILVAVITIAVISNGNAAPSLSKTFDHFTTGFPLTGKHISVSCESCHIKAVFKGTPNSCRGCHNGRIAPGKHARHIISDDNCDNCHTTFSWQTAAMDHGSVLGSCITCHNGAIAQGKPPKHIVTNARCDECHGTVAWIPARFSHENITGRCDSCHNGQDATGKHATHLSTTQDCGECHQTVTWSGGSFNHINITGRCDACHINDKPGNHIQTSGDCGDCHSTNTWITGGFNHDNIGGRRCDSCHNGQVATGKSAQHVLTSDDCGTCHNTATWLAVNFDHSRVTGSCNNCHLSHKPNNHFITSRECDACHITTNWITTHYSHSSGNYPGDHRSGVNCINCHTSNSEVINWPFAAYRPDCAGCHANDFKQDSHKHIVDGNTVFYTVSELRDCAGSCHKEETLVNQHHRPSDGNW